VPKLSLRDRFRLAWELTWPLALMDLLVMLFIHGLLDAQGQTLDSIWAVVVFFAASPWVIRRAFRRDYSGHHIEATHGQESSPLVYQERLKVMWLLAWRSTVLMLLAVLALSGLFKLAGGSALDLAPQGPLANALGLTGVDAIVSLAFTPFLVPGMLRKKYRGFRLVLQPPPRRKK